MSDKDKRLEQMRRSQKNLRIKRNEELIRLSKELEVVKAKNDELETHKTNMALLVKDSKEHYKLTGEKLIRIMDLFPAEVEESISLKQFSSIFKLQYPALLVGDQCILKQMYVRLLGCFTSFVYDKNETLLGLPILKFLPMYGPRMVAQHWGHMEMIIGNDRIPVSWLDGKEYLPRDVIDIVEILRYVGRTLDLNKSDRGVLMFTMNRRLSVTPFGPVMAQKDLDECIDVSYNPEKVKSLATF